MHEAETRDPVHNASVSSAPVFEVGSLTPGSAYLLTVFARWGFVWFVVFIRDFRYCLRGHFDEFNLFSRNMIHGNHMGVKYLSKHFSPYAFLP